MIFSNNGTINLRETPSKFRLLAVGDCIPGGRTESLFKSRSENSILGELKPLLSEADIVLFNLETPLCQTGGPIPKCGSNFRIAPETAYGLKAAGFNVAALANNHILDFGPEGIEETISTLKRAKILYHGAGNTPNEAKRPLECNINGVDVTFLNYAEGEFSKLTIEGKGAAPLELVDNKAAIEKAKEASDIVVVSVHAGNEYQHFPSPWIQSVYRQFISFGADVVIGHHPHIPQGMEWYQNGLIVYSLGDFMFEYRNDRGTCVTLILELWFDGEGMTSVRIHPIRKNVDASMSFLRGMERRFFINHINRLSEPLNNIQSLTQLWEQGVIRRFEGFYIEKLKKNISLVGSSKDKEKKFAAGFLFNMFDCPSHREALKTVFTLIHNGRFAKDPILQEYLASLDNMLEILSHPESLESSKAYRNYFKKLKNVAGRIRRRLS